MIHLNLVKKTNEDLELLKKNLQDRKPFNILFDDETIGIEYIEFGNDDHCYHGVCHDSTGNKIYFGRITIEQILRAITDENYFIKVSIKESRYEDHRFIK